MLQNLADRHRPWKCNICGVAFFKKMPLDEHMAKHVGQPQYSCDQCPKKFYHLSGWKRHMQHHGEARPFVCSVSIFFKSCHKQINVNVYYCAIYIMVYIYEIVQYIYIFILCYTCTRIFYVQYIFILYIIHVHEFIFIFMLNMYMYFNVIIILKPYYFYSNNIKTHKKCQHISSC